VQTTLEPPEAEPPAETEPPAQREPPARPPGTDITSPGNVNATSEFPASLAIDGDPTASWFSAGSGAC
jgi:hypothetical protein